MLLLSSFPGCGCSASFAPKVGPIPSMSTFSQVETPAGNERAEPLHGRETWQQGFELMRRAFPDLHADVVDVVAAGDKVVLRLTLSGTHRASPTA